MIPGQPQPPQPGQPPQGQAPQPQGSQPPQKPGAPPAPQAPDPLVANAQEVAKLLGTPTWDDAINLMRQDGPRGFRVDIETDSTISADLMTDQEGITQLLTGLTGFWNAIGPAVESGMVPVDVVKSMTLAAVRRAKLGRVIEDAIDQIGENKPQQGPNEKILEAQYKMANLAFQQEQLKADTETKNRQMALDERSMAIKEAELTGKFATQNREIDLQHQREVQKNDIAAAGTVSAHMAALLDHVAKMHAETMRHGGSKRIIRQRDPVTGETHFVVEALPGPQSIQ